MSDSTDSPSPRTDPASLQVALREAEQRYRAVFESSRDGKIIYTPDGTVVEANPAACRMYGYARDEIIGVHAPSVIHPDALLKFREFQATCGSGGEFRCETVDRRRDGTAFPVEVVGTSVVIDGRPHLMSVVRDITDRRQADAALRQSEQHLRSLIEQSAAGIAHTDLNGRIDFANDRFCQIVGYTREELIGLRVHDLTHPDDLANTAKLVADSAATGREYGMEKRYVRKDGSTVWVAVSASVLKDTAGGPQSIMGVVIDISDRKRAEAEAERSLAQWRAVVTGMADGVVVADAAGNLLEWNAAALEMHGYATVAEVRKHLSDFPAVLELAADDGRLVPLTDWPMSRILRGETFSGYEVAVRRLDAEFTRVISYSGSPLIDEDGRVALAVLTLHDVTEQRRAQAALRASEELVRTIAENSTQGFAMMDARGHCTYANRAWLDMTGYSAEEIGAGPLHYLVHHHYPDGRPYPMEECPIDRALPEHFDVRAHEDVFFRKDGSTFPVLVAASPIFKDGRPVSTVIEIRDITLAKRSEAEREQLLDRERAARMEAETLAEVGELVNGELDLEALVQKVTDETTKLTRAQFGAFFYNVVDDKGESYSLYTLSGVPRQAFASFPMPRMTQVFGPTFRGEGVVRSDDVTKDKRYGQNAPYHGMPNGHLPVRSYLAVPVASRSGKVLGGLFFGHAEVGIFNERDERIVLGIAAQTAVAMDNARLYEAAQKANAAKDALLASEQSARSEAERTSRMKDEFLATLSHELRTPLNAILGWSQVIRRPSADAVDVAQGLEVIERNARAQAQIIEDLLDMSRIISGKVRLDVQRLALEPILRAAVESATPAADAKGIRIQAILDPLAGPVSGDPNRLQQIFWNLLTNAVKFTPKGGRVQVLLERVNSHLEASVIDTGEGIKPEFLPHVFDRFRQADATTTRRHGGLGLGLSIVKQLVELHGGSIRAKSMGEGQGATFTVSLPLAVIHPEPDAEMERRHPKAGGHTQALATDLCAEIAGIKVLVVDDEPDARALVKRLLEECGAVVFSAASAAEALETVSVERPDVLVSDIGMPEENGYTLIQRVRALGEDRGGKVPALALTAYARAEDRMRAIRAGFQMHVPKPVEPAELITMVASLVGRG